MCNMREMLLSDTIKMMTSRDYQERFKAEYHQNMIRYCILRDMVNRWDEGKLGFELTCPRSTYTLQLQAMSDYIAVLEARAVMEGIEL